MQGLPDNSHLESKISCSTGPTEACSKSLMKIRMNNRTTRRRDLQAFPEWNRVKTLRILLLLGTFLGPAALHGADDLVPGENLVVDGIPAIPKALAQAQLVVSRHTGRTAAVAARRTA